MTKLQKDIVELLKEDSRLSPLAIAKALGQKEDDIIGEIDNLVADGIIVKYTTIINDDKTEDNEVEALIEVKVTPQKNMGFDALAREIALYPEVKNLYLMSGTYDLAVTVVGKNLREISNFVHEKLAVMDNVVSTATHFILKCYKLAGVNLAGDTNENRIPVQP